MQLGKILGALYGFIALIGVPFVLLFAILGILNGKNSDSTMGIASLIMVSCGVVLLYSIIGFIGGLIIGLIYNFLVKFVGGLKMDVELEEESSMPKLP